MKKQTKTDTELEKLKLKIIELRDSIEEEYDCMELIEDEIQDIFACNLECRTCSPEEQGICLADFKKANLYWLRKIAQDEYSLKSMAEQINEMKDNLTKMNAIVQRQLKELRKEKPFERDDEGEVVIDEDAIADDYKLITVPEADTKEKEPKPKRDLGYIA